MAVEAGVVLRLRHVRLRVRDLDRSVAFYRDLFGFRPEPYRGSSGRFCEQIVTAPHGEAFGLVLVQGPGSDIAGSLEQISFEAATVGDAAELYRKARASGAQAIQPRLCNGSWRTFIFDPDGHKLEITVKETGLARDSVG